jgi:acetyl-CoA acyltransferase 1
LDKDGNNPKTIVVDQDEGIRASSTVEGLGKLKPAFNPAGSTTAGNASQISDGAAAVLLMKRKTAQKLNLPILGKYVTACSVGVSIVFFLHDFFFLLYKYTDAKYLL